jgi:quinol monooxygenase YgiN
VATTITKIVRYRVKKKKLLKLKATIGKFVDDIKRSGSGIISYEVFQEKDDPTTFVHVMIFKDKAAERAHVKSEHTQKWIKTLHSLCKEEPELTDLKLVKSIQDSIESSSAADSAGESQQ